MSSIKAIVVYESHWGNTAAIARAIAEGIGPQAQALSTSEASADVVAGAQLIVAGSPLIAFSLPTEGVLKNMATSEVGAPVRPDLSHPSMRSWLASLPRGSKSIASYETRIWWSPGSAAKAITKLLEALGHRAVAKPERFMVKGKYGPLKEGELERAKAWGAQLAQAAGRQQP